MSNQTEYRINRNATQKEIKELEENLVAYNDSFVIEDYNPFGVIARNAAAQVIAGVSGYSHWGRAYIKYLWVDKSHRNQGLGSMLMDEVDTLARSRNCRGVEVETMSFQAIGFYEKNGFTQHGRVGNFSDGHYCIYYTKEYEQAENTRGRST